MDDQNKITAKDLIEGKEKLDKTNRIQVSVFPVNPTDFERIKKITGSKERLCMGYNAIPFMGGFAIKSTQKLI